jgi:hypothetical protein
MRTIAASRRLTKILGALEDMVGRGKQPKE